MKQSNKEISFVQSGKSTNSIVPPSHLVGLGHYAPLLKPTPRVFHQPRKNRQVSQAQTVGYTTAADTADSSQAHQCTAGASHTGKIPF